MDLFLTSSLLFEKSGAAETALPEDPNGWPDELLQELYKQVPYVADFDPQVVLSKVDGQRGYGFGHIQIGNKTELPPEAPKAARESAGIQQARIPIIIRDSNLQPFDTLITGKGDVLPLTEQRLREALFRPQSFDMTSKTPGDTSLIAQLYPPFRNNYGGGAGITVMTGGMGKDGSAKEASVLSAIIPTASQSDYNFFFAELAEPGVKEAYVENAAALSEALQAIARSEPVSLQKRAAVLPHLIKTSVVQIQKAPEGYLLKSASHNLWAPQVQRVDRGHIVRAFGEKIALDADLSGSVTMADGVEKAPEDTQEEPTLIKDYGVYRVCAEQGKEIVGYVFPNLIDLDGTELPLALFYNGSQMALQGEIMGVRSGDAVPLHEGRPRGKGCFFSLDQGEAHATLPLEVHGAFTDDSAGAALIASTVDGRKVRVSVQPNVQQVTLVDETMVLPESFKWLSLDGAEEIALAATPDAVGKEVQASLAVATVTVRGDSAGSYSLEGLGLSKMAESERSFLSFDDALFLLGGLGVDLAHAQRKLAFASSGMYPVEVRVHRLIKTAEAVEEAMWQRAEQTLAQIPDLRRSLVKEAGMIPDPVAVDTVLSLGFINPENLSVFVRALPQIEEAQRRMCELLIASRLGLREIPTTALERAVKATEEVLDGLKIIAFNRN